jgi:hypothetical protein
MREDNEGRVREKQERLPEITEIITDLIYQIITALFPHTECAGFESVLS